MIFAGILCFTIVGFVVGLAFGIAIGSGQGN